MDQKNLLADSNTNVREFRCNQKIEELGPTIQYVQGQPNSEADNLSRLTMQDLKKKKKKKKKQGTEIMLNYPLMDHCHPILNDYQLGLKLLYKYQQLD